MPLISSYHSNTPGETIYHNHSSCSEGNKIEIKLRVHGVGKLQRCKICAELLNNRK